MVSKPRSLKKLLAAFGVAMVAALAMSVVSAASASAAAPENTVSPVVSPTAPETGKVETTSNGTWTGSPTSYAYVWFRCNTSGVECKSIPGATKSAYTPVVADVGKTLLTSVTATNGEGSGVALSKPSGKVTEPPPPLMEYWYTCGTKKGSLFSCSPNGSTEWVKLPGSTPTGVTLRGASPFTMKFTFNGAKVEISCTTLTGEGSIENEKEKEKQPATASKTKFTFDGCSVATPSKCTVRSVGNSDGFTFSPLKGEFTAFETQSAVKFSSEEGSTFSSFEFEGAECSLNKTHLELSGTFTGISNSTIVGSNARFEFTAASSSGLRIGAIGVTLEGNSEIETTTGKLVKLGPF